MKICLLLTQIFSMEALFQFCWASQLGVINKLVHQIKFLWLRISGQSDYFNYLKNNRGKTNCIRSSGLSANSFEAMEKPSHLVVTSPNLKYTDDYIYSDYSYEDTLVTRSGANLLVSLAYNCILIIVIRTILRPYVYFPHHSVFI